MVIDSFCALSAQNVILGLVHCTLSNSYQNYGNNTMHVNWRLLCTRGQRFFTVTYFYSANSQAYTKTTTLTNQFQ